MSEGVSSAAFRADGETSATTLTRALRGEGSLRHGEAKLPRLRRPAAASRMQPVSFGTCFGWLHLPERPFSLGEGIVLCPALGQEARHVHRLWRILADRLAADGYLVLRFDYPDTGDSWFEPGGKILPAWRDSIALAAGYLRRQGGASITLLGLRFGATLAALADARQPADRLVLLAPVVSGRAYIRELRAFARLSEGGPTHGPEENGLEASGWRLDADTIADISAIDLRKLPPSASRRLIFEASAGQAAALSGPGTTVADFVDFAAMVQNAHTNSFPEASFARITAWLADTVCGRTPADRTATAWPLMPACVMRLPGVRELPCRFSADPDGEDSLFGMLCEPDGPPASDLALVICNNGSNPHYGHGRLAVTMGRDLARAGLASFRLDFAGLGDSSGGPDEPRPHLFDAPREAEISAALTLLEGYGYRRFVLTGICAGAYHAYHGALADPRVVGVYAINMPKFRWPAGDDPDLAIRESLHSTRYYMGGLRRRETWIRLLRGRIDVRTVGPALLQRLGRRTAAAIVMPLASRFGLPCGIAFPRVSMAALSRRGVRVHLLYGHDDPGVEEVVRCFGPSGRIMTRLPGCSVAFPEDIDHPISHAQVRDALCRRITAFLQELRADG